MLLAAETLSTETTVGLTRVLTTKFLLDAQNSARAPNPTLLPLRSLLPFIPQERREPECSGPRHVADPARVQRISSEN